MDFDDHVTTATPTVAYRCDLFSLARVRTQIAKTSLLTFTRTLT